MPEGHETQNAQEEGVPAEPIADPKADEKQRINRELEEKKKHAKDEQRSAAMAVLMRKAEIIKDQIRKQATHKERKKAKAYLKKGVEYYNAKEYEKAVRCFRKSLRYDEHFARAHTNLGNTYYKMRRMADALGHWHLATVSEPDSEAAYKAQEKINMIEKTNNFIEMMSDV